MKIEPSFESFAASYAAAKPSVIYTRLVADLETPVSAMLKLADRRPHSFLLESVEGGAVRGRYSFIGLKPDLIWRCRGDRAEINRRFRVHPQAFEPCSSGALASLRDLVRETRIDLPPGLPPMSAGLFGYMGYDMVRLMEHLPTNKPEALGLPDAVFLRPTLMAIFDNVEDLVTIVTTVWPQPDQGARAAYNQACERLADVVADFGRNLPERREVVDALANLPEPSSNITEAEFHAMVNKAKEYILAGDIFQVVLSQRFELPVTLPPFSLYRALRRLNPSPFLFFLDLGRNDVGRVAEIGSVEVTEQFVIEYYSHVMHIVSNVEGTIRPGLDAIDALAAGFPAGTVSGAPKVRAMEIIDELEKERRGVYAGAVGYFAASGAMDTCIALRTAVVKDGTMYVQAGGGIVADSTPAGEFQESCQKARALVRAAQEAVRFAADRTGN